MIQIIRESNHVAKKVHTCDFCGKFIEIGEQYCKKVLKFNGKIYTFKSHCKCEFIANELAKLCNIDQEISSDEFHDMCSDYCVRYVCPFCTFIDMYDECVLDNCYLDCMDKIVEKLKNYEIIFDNRSCCYKMVKKVKDAEVN